MRTFFVTSSGTEIGKTFVTSLLSRQLHRRGVECRALKPVLSGFDDSSAADSDAGVLLRAQGVEPNADAVAEIAPWRFAAPLSPDMAAAKEGRSIDFDALIAYCRQPRDTDVVLIEGIGGVMVPLDRNRTVLDWIEALSAPAILVVGSYLGSISHALTAAEALQGKRIEIAGIVISESADAVVPGDRLAATLARFLPRERIAVVPRKKKAEQESFLPDLTHLLET